MRLFKSLLFQPSPREWWGCFLTLATPSAHPPPRAAALGTAGLTHPPEPRGRHLRWVPGPPAGVAQGMLRGAASSRVMTQRCPGVWRSPRGSSHTPALAEAAVTTVHSVRALGQAFPYPHRLQEPALWTMVQPGSLEPGGPGLNPSHATYQLCDLGKLLSLSGPQLSSYKIGLLRHRLLREELTHRKGSEQPCPAHGEVLYNAALLSFPFYRWHHRGSGGVEHMAE